MISQIVSKMSVNKIFGRVGMIYALSSIAILGLLVWSHHMFTVGMNVESKAYFSAASLVIGLPTGIKVFSWLGTMLGGEIRKKLPMWYSMEFIYLFTIGGLSGIILANTSVDIYLHETVFVVAHFHTVLSLGAVYGIFGGFYYWGSKMMGYSYDEEEGKIQNLVLLVGVNLTFMPLHISGLEHQNRRYMDSQDKYIWINKISSRGSIISVISVCLFIKIVIDQINKKKRVCNDYWEKVEYFDRAKIGDNGERKDRMNKNLEIEFVLESPTKYHHYNIRPIC
jgi:cytochrome c oxidase subunit 1